MVLCLSPFLSTYKVEFGQKCLQQYSTQSVLVVMCVPCGSIDPILSDRKTSCQKRTPKLNGNKEIICVFAKAIS